MAASVKDISNHVIIPRTCRERFLPVSSPACAALRRRGVESAGLSDLRAPYLIGRRSPRFHVLCFTLGGTAEWRTSEASGRLRAGDLWFGPGDHDYEYAARPRWLVAWFHLRYDALRDAATRTFVLRRTTLGSQVRDCMLGLLAENSGRVAENYAEILGLLMERELNPPAQPRDERAAEWAALWREIGENLQQPWTIEAMARRAHVSPVQFHRITVRLCGAPPSSYLTNMRLKRGAEMLRQTTYKLEQIALLVGYSTPFAFSKAFRRHWGESPQSYRKSRAHR